MSELLVAGAAFLVVDAEQAPVADGWVLIADGRVEAVGGGTPPHAANVVDARGLLVMPGLVNAHHHLFQGTSRGFSTEGGLLGWLRFHYARWQHLDAEHVAAAARASIAQLLMRGCTTTAAFEFLHPAGHDFVSPVLAAADEIGIRLLYVRGSATHLEPGVAELLAADGVDVDRLIEPRDVALRRTAEVISRQRTDRLRYGCGPTTPVLDDIELHAELARLASEADVPMHVHFHPLAAEGGDVVDLAERLHILREGNVFAHGSRLSSRDVGRLGHHGVGVVHCPSASLLLGYRLPELQSWLDANPRVAVAVDGSASNDRGSLLGEAQMAYYVQGQPAPVSDGRRLSASTALRLVTGSAAATLGWDGAGSLTVGSLGDVVAFDTRGIDAAGVGWLQTDVITGLLRSYQGERAHTVIIGGKLVVSDSILLTADEEDIARAAAGATDVLGQLSGGRTTIGQGGR